MPQIRETWGCGIQKSQVGQTFLSVLRGIPNPHLIPFLDGMTSQPSEKGIADG